MTQLATTWDTLGRFSQSDVGIEPTINLAALGLPSDKLIEILAAHPEARPEEKEVADFTAVLSRWWARHVGDTSSTGNPQ